MKANKLYFSQSKFNASLATHAPFSTHVIALLRLTSTTHISKDNIAQNIKTVHI